MARGGGVASGGPPQADFSQLQQGLQFALQLRESKRQFDVQQGFEMFKLNSENWIGPSGAGFAAYIKDNEKQMKDFLSKTFGGGFKGRKSADIAYGNLSQGISSFDEMERAASAYIAGDYMTANEMLGVGGEGTAAPAAAPGVAAGGVPEATPPRSEVPSATQEITETTTQRVQTGEGDLTVPGYTPPISTPDPKTGGLGYIRSSGPREGGDLNQPAGDLPAVEKARQQGIKQAQELAESQKADRQARKLEGEIADLEEKRDNALSIAEAEGLSAKIQEKRAQAVALREKSGVGATTSPREERGIKSAPAHAPGPPQTQPEAREGSTATIDAPQTVKAPTFEDQEVTTTRTIPAAEADVEEVKESVNSTPGPEGLKGRTNVAIDKLAEGTNVQDLNAGDTSMLKNTGKKMVTEWKLTEAGEGFLTPENGARMIHFMNYMQKHSGAESIADNPIVSEMTFDAAKAAEARLKVDQWNARLRQQEFEMAEAARTPGTPEHDLAMRKLRVAEILSQNSLLNSEIGVQSAMINLAMTKIRAAALGNPEAAGLTKDEALKYRQDTSFFDKYRVDPENKKGFKEMSFAGMLSGMSDAQLLQKLEGVKGPARRFWDDKLDVLRRYIEWKELDQRIFFSTPGFSGGNPDDQSDQIDALFQSLMGG